MRGVSRVVVLGFVCAMLPSASVAQSFNIDICDPTNPTMMGVPTSGYPAATGVGGTWNDVNGTQATVALVDVSGAPTAATIGWPQGGYIDSWLDLSGNAGKLMNDYLLLGFGFGPSVDWSVQGLANGEYRVTFYSRPLDSYSESGVTQFTLIGGASGPQTCDGLVFDGFNGFRYGLNMVQDTVTVANNTLSWRVALISGAVGSFNGVQIEQLVPGSVHTYCATKPNSLGCTPVIGSSGVPSVSGGAFAVTASNMRSHRAGFLLWGTRQNGMPYQGETALLCVARPFTRTSLQDSGGASSADDCSGTYSFTFDTSYLALHGLSAGESVLCQYWSIDEGAPGGVGLTKGLSFVLAP